MNNNNVMKYFAYGNDMLTRVFTESAPSAEPIGFGRLADHRLAFTCNSQPWQTGVANIAPTPGLWTYGVIYAIDKDDLPQFENSKGVSIELARTDVSVRTHNGQVNAMTHIAVKPEKQEMPPAPEYLEQLISGALEHKLPKSYRDFLEYVRTEFIKGSRNEGLLLTPTTNRSFSAGEPLIRVNPLDQGSAVHKKFGVMYRDGRKTIGKVEVTNDVTAGTCQADQALRASIGVNGQWCFGQRVMILPSQGALPNWSPIHPRTLILPTQAIGRNDTEKNYCVLHPDRIKVIGLQEGDFVRLFAATPGIPEGATSAKAKAITIRVFTGSSGEVTRSEQEKYPDLGKLYLDMDGRRQLGFPDHDWQGIPVLIRPALGKALTSRSLFYGLTVLLGIGAVFQILQAFAPHWNSYADAAVSLAISGAITLALSIVDLRSRLRY